MIPHSKDWVQWAAIEVKFLYNFFLSQGLNEITNGSLKNLQTEVLPYRVGKSPETWRIISLIQNT